MSLEAITSLPTTSSSEYPQGATPVAAASGNQSNAIASATLPGAAGKTTYISGFEVCGSGATVAVPVAVTVTGIVGGVTLTYTYAFVAGILLPNNALVIGYTKSIPASGTNQGITVSCPASGLGGTNNTVVVHGYQL